MNSVVFEFIAQQAGAVHVLAIPFHTPFPSLLLIGYRRKFHRTIFHCYKAATLSLNNLTLYLSNSMFS